MLGTALAVAVGTTVSTTVLQETSKHLLAKLRSTSPPISYQVVSIDRMRKHELTQYTARELVKAFDLELDDPIVEEYYVFKVRIDNEGAAMATGFKLQALVNRGEAKVVDVQHVLRSPANKTMAIVHSLPKVTWGDFRRTSEVVLKWTAPQGPPVLGYYVYRSTLKDMGFGKFDPRLIKRTCLVLREEASPRGYYAVAAVGQDGTVSDLSAAIKYPDVLASSARFTNVVVIDPGFDEKTGCRAAGTRIHPSLPEALEKWGRNNVFLITKRRADFRGSVEQLKEYSPELRVLYEDEVDFFRGRVQLSFPDGLDSAGKADLYFVAKPVSDAKPEIELTLIGQPTVPFTRRGGDQKMALPPNVSSGEAERRSLTPKMITAWADDKTISLVWVDGSDRRYTGIRVFRVAVSGAQGLDSLGEEIHDGEYFVGALKCQPRREAKETEIGLPGKTLPPPREPPKRSREITPGTPAPPRSLSVEGPGAVIGAPVTYYSDTGVRGQVTYRYTIYTYDAENHYSHPIQIVASLRDSLDGVSCSLERSAKQN